MLTTLMTALCFALTSGIAGSPETASPEPHDLLRQQFQTRAAEAIASVDGVFGVVVKDLTTGETFGAHENVVFTQASVIKVPILVELFKQAQEGTLALEKPITVQGGDLVGGSGVMQHLTPGRVSLPARDLAVLMIVLSDNTATNMLIDLVGMENVNATMAELGLPETRLQRKMMDREARLQDRENISTPAEMARLLEMLHQGTALDPEFCQEILKILALPKEGQINRNLPAHLRVANKTGSVGGVVNDIGIVHLENRPFIVSAMINWHADAEAAKEAIAAVSYLAYQYFDRVENSNRYGHRK